MLKKLADNIWTVDGPTVPFFGLPYTTRMTIIRLANGELWIHSPLKVSYHIIKAVSELGKVKYLVSPNKLHHLFIADWKKQFPEAVCCAPPGLVKKRSDIKFSKALGMRPAVEWSKEIDQTIFKGSPAMQEVVFFHISSKTLILADLIENFDPDSFNWWQRIVAHFTGILSPDGKTPVDWRLSFAFGKKEAKKALSVMLGWEPENIVISHGECIYGDGLKFLKRSFSWV